RPNGGYPQVIINSLDIDKGIAMLDAGRLDDLTDYLAAGMELLVRAGADFGFIAANTPHLVFDEVQRRSSIPLVSIVRASSDYAKDEERRWHRSVSPRRHGTPAALARLRHSGYRVSRYDRDSRRSHR